MTTNSYGSALPAFDFPQTVAKATRVAPRRLPLSAKGLPLVAAAGIVYYVGSRLASIRGPMSTASVEGSSGLVNPRLKALEDAYGDRSSLENLEAAAQAYSASPVAHPPTEANMRFRESLRRAKDHAAH